MMTPGIDLSKSLRKTTKSADKYSDVIQIMRCLLFKRWS